MSYLNARYYNGTIGKFATEDPQFWGSQNLSDPQSLNAYSYSSNNPITLSDPSGLSTLSDIQKQLNIISAQIAALKIQVSNYVASQAKIVTAATTNAAKNVSAAISNASTQAKNYVSNPDPDKNIFQERIASNGTTWPSDFDAVTAMIGMGAIEKVGAGLVKASSKAVEITFKTEHALKHIKEIGLASKEIEAAIKSDILSKELPELGKGVQNVVNVCGAEIVYRAFQFKEGLINVGTYFLK